MGGVSGGQPLVAHEVAELVAAEVDRTAVVLGCGRQRRNGGGWSAQVEMAQRARWGESCARGLMDCTELGGVRVAGATDQQGNRVEERKKRERKKKKERKKRKKEERKRKDFFFFLFLR